MKKINEQEFAEITSSKTVLVDFFATWCGPCKMLSPVLEELSSEYEGKLEFVKVDVDECGNVAQKFGVMSIPTVILFKDGKAVSSFMGFQPKAAVKSFIDKNL